MATSYKKKIHCHFYSFLFKIHLETKILSIFSSSPAYNIEILTTEVNEGETKNGLHKRKKNFCDWPGNVISMCIPLTRTQAHDHTEYKEIG